MSEDLGAAEIVATDQLRAAPGTETTSENPGPGAAPKRSSSSPGGARRELEQRLERIAELVEELEAGSDPASRALSKELLQAVMALHAAGLDRLLDLTRASGAAGDALMERFARDRQVRTLLLLHDLHPWDAITRVREALRAHEGKVEIVCVDDSSVHVRVDGPKTLVRTVEDALREAAPDLDSIVVDRQEPLVVLERRR